MAEKWSWSIWLESMEKSDLPEDVKVIGREFRAAFGRRKSGVVHPWELASAPGYSDLAPLCEAGFAYLMPGQGVFIPDLDLLPAPGSITLSRSAKRLLRRLLAGEPLDLYRINRPGYITQHDDPARWLLHGDRDPWRAKVNDAAADELLAARLIEPDGCGHGWPFQWTSRFRVRRRRLVGVRGSWCHDT